MNTYSTARVSEEQQMLRPMIARDETLLKFDRHEDSQISQYVAVIRRRKWAVAALVLAGILAAIAYTFIATPLYRATTTVQIQRESARVVDIDDVEPQSAVSGTEFYQTQYGLLQSRAVAADTVRRLRLADNIEFLTGYSGADPEVVSARSRQDRSEIATDLVVAHTVVTPVRNSGLVEVSFEATDNRTAARVADTLAESFIALNLQRKYDATGYARQFLENELGKVRQRLEESERALVTYAGNEQLIEINRQEDQQGRTQGQSLSEMDLEVLNRALGQARADRMDAEARLRAARSVGSSSEAIADQSLGSIRTSLAELEARYQRDLATFKPDYPPMVALRQQIDSLRSAVNSRSGQVTGALEANFRAASNREASLQANVNALKEAVLDQNRRGIQYNIFQRDADTNRALYDSLLERYKQIGVAGGIGVNNVAIVDKAQTPGSPYTPNLLANLLLGMVGGFLVGLLLAFILDQLDDAIKTPADLEKALNLPLLGVVPKEDFDDPIAEISDRKSVISEAYLAIQTSLSFSTSEGVPKALAVTSANASEGKSTTAFAIAATLGRLGRKVLLIDGDMRNPSLHKMLGVANEHGLAEILSDNADFPAVILPTELPNLSVILSGPIPPNPAELLTGAKLHDTIARGLAQFDHVIVDSPPVLGLSDGPLIASAIHNTVFVISANSTSTKSAVASLRRLLDAHAHVIGTVLTKFQSSEHGYAYNYDYNYGARRNWTKI